MEHVVNNYLQLGCYLDNFYIPTLDEQFAEFKNEKGIWRYKHGHRIFIPNGTPEQKKQAIKQYFENIRKYNNVQKKYFEVSESEKIRFKKDVNELLKNTQKGKKDTVKVGILPYIYVFLGISKGNVYIEKGNIQKDMGIAQIWKNHDVDIKEIERIPELYSDPVLVMKSATQQNALVSVLNAKDKSERQIVLALHPNKYGVGLHAIPSAYGKDDIEKFVTENYKNNRIIYVNEKSLRQLPSLYLRFTALKTNNSITKKTEIVNSLMEQEQVSTDEIEEEIINNIGLCLDISKELKETEYKKAYLKGYFLALNRKVNN